SDVTSATKPGSLIRHNTAQGRIPLISTLSDQNWLGFAGHASTCDRDLHRTFVGEIRPNPLSAFALFKPNNGPELPSVAPAKCNTKYSPERSVYVRRSRFMMRPSGVLTRFIANTDYQVCRKQTKKKESVNATHLITVCPQQVRELSRHY